MYLVFSCSIPFGGFNDYRDKFNTLEEAKDYLWRSGISRGHIVLISNNNFKVVTDYDSYRNPKWQDAP